MGVDAVDQFKLAEEAALWVMKLGEQPDAQSRREFFDWVRQSPKHMEEFMLARAVSTQFNGMDPQRQIQIDPEALASLREESVVALDRAPAAVRRAGNKGMRWLSGLAAALTIVVAGWWTLGAPLPAHTYATGTGDQQSLKLPDGSLMQLNAHSRVEVRFLRHEREIRLLAGEALFTVESDRARPFRVKAGTATIEALGTQFNVYRRDENTQVSVVEGAVRIVQPLSPPVRLDAGAEANITSKTIRPALKPDIPKAVAWRSRRLVFHGDRLEDVAREFNRYNRNPITLEGPQIADRQISGVFDADDPRPLIDFLATQPGFAVTATGNATVIRLLPPP